MSLKEIYVSGIISGLLLFAMFGLITVFGIKNLVAAWNTSKFFHENGMLTQAQVVQVQSRYDKIGYGADVTYEFEVVGAAGIVERYSASTYMWVIRSPSLQTGDSIDILYDPNNPSLSYIAQNSEPFRIALGCSPGVGGGCLFIWIFTLLLSSRQRWA